MTDYTTDAGYSPARRTLRQAWAALASAVRCLALLQTAALAACMSYGPAAEEDFDTGLGSEAAGRGLFITCEGNFMYGNASLSFYDTRSRRAENEVFARANGMKLGDVAQSMTIHGSLGWIVVNNSGIVFAIDLDTFREAGRITGFTSPRYMHFISDQKAYVTQIWDPRICIVNPKTFEITGYIDTGMDFASGSTEQMVQIGEYVYTNCWSYQNRILKIDTRTDTVAGELVVGIQPTSLAEDCNGRLWTITDGGYEGSPYGYEAPSLCCIDTETFTVERRFQFALGEHPSEIQTNAAADVLYWINDDIWSMPVDAEMLPARPFVEYDGTIYYGLTVSPENGDVYVADAIDHVQNGVILRYSAEGQLLDTFTVGVSPGAFCWR